MRGIIHAQMKTDRASTHLKRLQEALAEYRKNPFTITTQDDLERQRHTWRLFMRPAPSEIPLSIGEFAYSLRSALDHLAWQLALLSGGTPSPKTAFPIHRDETPKSEDRFRQLTWDVPCEAAKIIRRFQPYQRGADFHSHPLWQLSQLCNLDKHCTMAVNSDSIAIKTSGPPVPVHRRDIDDGTYRGIEFTIPLAAKNEVCFDPQVTETIFGRPIDEPGDPFTVSESALAEIHSLVRNEIIPAFYPFFPI